MICCWIFFLNKIFVCWLLRVSDLASLVPMCISSALLHSLLALFELERWPGSLSLPLSLSIFLSLPLSLFFSPLSLCSIAPVHSICLLSLWLKLIFIDAKCVQWQCRANKWRTFFDRLRTRCILSLSLSLPARRTNKTRYTFIPNESSTSFNYEIPNKNAKNEIIRAIRNYAHFFAFIQKKCIQPEHHAPAQNGRIKNAKRILTRSIVVHNWFI